MFKLDSGRPSAVGRDRHRRRLARLTTAFILATITGSAAVVADVESDAAIPKAFSAGDEKAPHPATPEAPMAERPEVLRPMGAPDGVSRGS